MDDQTSDGSQDIRQAIEQERQLRMGATLRGCRLSEAVRSRAQAYASAQLAAGMKPRAIAQRLGLSAPTIEHWFRERPTAVPLECPPPPDPKEAEEIRRQIAEERR